MTPHAPALYINVFLIYWCQRYIEQEGGGCVMRIELEGSLLKMTPENAREKEELNQLWTIIIGCIDEGKKLVPVGEYLPGVKEVAVFNIE